MFSRKSGTHLWEINAESVHVHAVQESGEALAEPRQALMHDLQGHEVLLQIRHGVAEFRELILEVFQWVRRGCVGSFAAGYALAERGARGRAEGRCWTRPW